MYQILDRNVRSVSVQQGTNIKKCPSHTHSCKAASLSRSFELVSSMERRIKLSISWILGMVVAVR